MFENYIGKQCEAVVIFGNYTSGGSAPLRIKGVLESYNSDYITIQNGNQESIISIKALLVLNVIG